MLKFLSVSGAILALGTTVVRGFSLSQQCQSAIFSTLSTPDAACLNSAGLVSVVTGAVAAPSASLVGPISGWLSGACASTPCTNDALANITTGLVNGCASDLAQLGITDSASDIASTLIPIVQEAYPTVQNIACLEETGNKTYCVVDMMNDLQSALGTLSPSAIESDVVGVINGQSMTIPPSVICNECVQAAYSILQTQQPGLVSGSVDPSQVDGNFTGGSLSIGGVLSSECGASFVASPSPTNVVVATGSSALSSAVSGASSLLSGRTSTVVGVAFSSLATVVAGFFLLA